MNSPPLEQVLDHDHQQQKPTPEEMLRMTKRKTVVLPGVSPQSSKSQILQLVPNHLSLLYTLWLFPSNDVRTMVLPITFIGYFCALSGSLLTTNTSPDLSHTSQQLPRAFLWTWLNILVFTILNQRSSETILEDSINKPWRPIPAGRLDVVQARKLLLFLIPGVSLVNFLWLGGFQETTVFFCATWMYNDLGGADEHFILRNLLNGAAYHILGFGALKVFCGGGEHTVPLAKTHSWLAIIAAVVSTTIQTQDLKDQEGDRARNRPTVPLVFGESFTRRMTSMSILLWSVLCPLYWRLDTAAALLPLALGVLVASRVMVLRDQQADKRTYDLWSMWISTIVFLPVIKANASFTSSYALSMARAY